MSVALRTFLIQSLVLPTHEDDPDSVSIERGAPVAPPAPRVSIPADWQDWARAAEMDGNVASLETMEQQAVAAGNQYAASTIRAAKLRAKRNGPQPASAPGDIVPDAYES